MARIVEVLRATVQLSQVLRCKQLQVENDMLDPSSFPRVGDMQLAVAGLDDGIDRFDASFGGIGGCPFAPKATGNICTEDLVYLLHEMGIETGIALERLSGVACDVETVIGRDLPGQVMKAGPRLKLHPMSDVATAVG